MTQPVLRIRLIGSDRDVERTARELEKAFDICEDSGTYPANALIKFARRYLVIRPPEPRKLVRRRI